MLRLRNLRRQKRAADIACLRGMQLATLDITGTGVKGPYAAAGHAVEAPDPVRNAGTDLKRVF